MADVNSTLGALYIGLLFTVYLTSSHNTQTMTYMQRTYDSVGTQLCVIFASLASTAHTAILCYTAYRYLVTHFGDTDYAGTAEWSFVGHFAIFTFIALIVQLYYAAKIASLYSGKRRIILVGSVVVLALAQTAFGILSAWSTSRLPFTSSSDMFAVNLRSALGWQMLATLICAVLCDSLICGIMLKQHREPRYTVKKEGVMDVLSRLLVETNLVTTVVAILSLAFYLAFRFHASGVSTAFAICTPKLYLLGMLASMNHQRDTSHSGISSSSPHQQHAKHESSLSDMFKGTPLTHLKQRNDVTVSKIGLPTPINDLFTAKDPNSPGWLRRTFSHQPTDSPVPFSNTLHPHQQANAQLHPSSSLNSAEVDALSISDYGAWTGHAYASSIDVGSPRSPRKVGFAQEQDRMYSPARWSGSAETRVKTEQREGRVVAYPFI